MAGSRGYRLGSIYSRLKGLLQAEALAEAEKPLWLDVYEAFPPHVEPRFERKRPVKNVTNILYPEDLIRAQFYSTFGRKDILDLSDNKDYVCNRFIAKYIELQKTSAKEDDVFGKTKNALASEGIILRTETEMKESMSQRFASIKVSEDQPSVGTLDETEFKVTNLMKEDDRSPASAEEMKKRLKSIFSTSLEPEDTLFDKQEEDLDYMDLETDEENEKK